MRINAALIGRVLQSIADHPEEHDQNRWIQSAGSLSEVGNELGLEDFESGCGTSACIAGWTVLHAGWKYQMAEEEYQEWDGQTVKLKEVVLVKAGEREDTSRTPKLALEALGDPYNKSDIASVFYDFNDERAIAKLMFFYENGRAPKQRDVRGEEYSIEGFAPEIFADLWYAKWEKAFPPKVEV